MVPVIAFVGRHNAGKTTLLTKIITHLNSKNIKVGVIKNAHHQLELPDYKDSEKLFNAGAALVHTNSPNMQITYSRNLTPLEDLLAAMEKDVDLIILEGYKQTDFPKIEVIREAVDKQPLAINNVIARVVDFNLEADLSIKCFNFEEIDEITQFIAEILNIKKP